MSKIIHFYYDFISPFAYFAWRKLPLLAKKYNYEIECHPVVFGKLLDKWGQLGPAEIPSKRNWLYQYCMRYAAINGFTYNPPKNHPFNPLPALRMSLKEVSGIHQTKVIDTIFYKGWSHGNDLGNISSLISMLEKKSLDGPSFSLQISKPEVKKLLIDETNMAIEKGVFGVPSFIINNNLFWGNDQMEHIELLLAGNDPLDNEKLNIYLDRPRAVDRWIIKNRRPVNGKKK